AGLQIEQERAQRLLNAIASDPTLDGRKEFAAQIADSDAQFDEYAGLIAAEYEADLDNWSEMIATWQEWRDVRDEKLLAAAMAGTLLSFDRLRHAEGEPLVEKFVELLDGIEADVQEYVAQTAADTQSQGAQGVLTILVVLVVGLVLVTGLGLTVAGWMRRDVAEVQGSLERMADGDLTVPVEVDSADELGQMATALRRAQEGLRSTLAAVVETAEELAGAAEELSASNTQVASGAE